MVLEFFTDFIYQLVSQSWLVATVLMKYILTFTALGSVYKNGRDLERFNNLIKNSSHEIVVLILTLGFLNIFAAVEVEPLLLIPSQIIALSYFGYLFWVY